MIPFARCFSMGLGTALLIAGAWILSAGPLDAQGHGGHGHGHGHGHGDRSQGRLMPQPIPADQMNLDFEDGDTPDPWILGGRGYSLELDTEVAHSGKKSLRLRFEDAGRFAVASMPYNAEWAVGKRLRITGFLKSDAIRNGYIGLWSRVDVGNRQVAFDNMADRGVSGTMSWQRHEIVFDVPKEATRIFFGAVLTGIGTGWVDNLTVTAEDIVPVPTAPVSGKVSAADGKPVAGATVALAKVGEGRLTAHAVTDAEGAFSLTDLEIGSYAATVSSVDSLAAAAPFELTKDGKSGLNLSLPVAGGGKVHGRVTGPGKAAAHEALSGAVVELVSWTADGPQVFAAVADAEGRFTGRAAAAEMVTVNLRHDDFLAANRVADMKDGSATQRDLPATSRLPPPNGVVVDFGVGSVVLETTHPTQPVGNLDDLVPMVESAKVLALGESAPGTSELFAVKQRLAERFHAAGFDHLALPFSAEQVSGLTDWAAGDGKAPEAALAGLGDRFWKSREAVDLLSWLHFLRHDESAPALTLLPYVKDGEVDPSAVLNAAQQGKKVLLWGTNRVVSRQGTLGSALAAKLGEGYQAWGGFFNQGAFLTEKRGPKADGSLERVWIGPTPRAHLEDIFNRLGGKLSAHSLRGISRDGEVGRWLSTPRLVRDTDGRFWDAAATTHSIALLDHFDGLFFVESTTIMTALP